MELKTYFAQDASGNIMPGATVTVYLANTTTLATGLQDESGAPLANPFTADSSAKVAFYAPDGLYDITVVGNGRTVTIRAQFVSVDGDRSVTTAIPIAVSDESTALTTGTARVTFRMPFAFTLTGVRASVTTAPTGSVLTVDINEGGASILSTKLTIDAGEKTSATAAAAPVISDTALADDAEITIDIDTVGSTAAGAGLKVYLIGTVV